MLEYVISGGQTGIDQLALITAKTFGIKTGGIAPKTYRTEMGSNYVLKEFGLIEDVFFNYSSRTEKNVINSDGTILFGNTSSFGTKQTIKFLIKHNKPYLDNPTPEEMYDFINNNNIKILNVAGNRGSKLCDDDIKKYAEIMVEFFSKFKK